MSDAVDPWTIRFVLNGAPVTATVEAADLLVDMVRGPFGLTGTKRSCEVEVCGACTVLVDGRPVSSCAMLAVDVDGREVTTIEGIGGPEALHPVQRAFVEHGALQCGFCTPGFVLATVALLAADPHPSEEAIRTHLAGNLCRCTGYVKIIEAVKSLA